MLVSVTGCGSPAFLRDSGPAALLVPVDEVSFEFPDGRPAPALPLAWKRNTLVIGLQNAGPSGERVLRPRSAAGWPERLAFHVVPGSFAELEVRADQRIVLPIAPGPGPGVDLELPHSLHSRRTPEIRLRWGTADAPAVAPSPPRSPPQSPPAGTR